MLIRNKQFVYYIDIFFYKPQLRFNKISLQIMSSLQISVKECIGSDNSLFVHSYLTLTFDDNVKERDYLPT